MALSATRLRDNIINALQTNLGITFSAAQLPNVQKAYGAIATGIIAELANAQLNIPSVPVPGAGLTVSYNSSTSTYTVAGTAASTPASSTGTGSIS